MACNASVAFGMCAYFALYTKLVAQTCVCVPRKLGSSGQEAVGSKFNIGVWHSLVVRLVRDQEAVGSNPVTPTKTKGQMPFFVLVGVTGKRTHIHKTARFYVKVRIP